jgi:hypothetical protein
VSWPSGKKEVFKDLPVDFIYTVVEGEGVRQKKPIESSTPASLGDGKPYTTK